MNRISPSALGNFEICSYLGHYLHGSYGSDNGKPSSGTKNTACGTCFHNLMDLHNNRRRHRMDARWSTQHSRERISKDRYIFI